MTYRSPATTFRVFGLALCATVTMVLGLAPPANASAVTTLHFDELPFRPVNGLHFAGVTFRFTINGVASTDANYDSGGPGQQFYTQDPSLEGNATGTLRIVFDTPTAFVQFGMALSSNATLSPGVKVKLKDKKKNIIGFTGVTTKPVPGDFFTEAQFAYNGDIAVKVLDLTFDGFEAPRFVIDNLSYVGPGAAAAKPSAPGGTAWAGAKAT
jgi:hypothetical protein